MRVNSCVEFLFMNQAKALDSMLAAKNTKIDAVIALRVPDEVLEVTSSLLL